MLRSISSFFVCLVLIQGAVVPAAVRAGIPSQTTGTTPPNWKLDGRWRIKFTMTSGPEKNLIFEARDHGAGSFLLMDTGPDNQPVLDSIPAVWAQVSNNRVSISGHAELELGTCCREIGALIFKGKFSSENSISGRLIFVTNIDDDENPNRFRSMVGTFFATRIAGDTRSKQTADSKQ